MDIGSKIKNARVNANLTQEQAAESLGVSRQTISNWENEKTYPDIISVVKMSDLYAVSLDHLLKGEKPTSKYLNYLEESTNVVESKEKQTKLILIVVYLVIWAIALIVFWFFTSGSDAMAYSIMFLWGLLPIVTLVLSLLIGKNNYWGRYKWLSPVVFGIMYMLAYYATFSTANMVANGMVHAPDFMMIVYGVVFSLVGLAIGSAINFLQGGRKMWRHTCEGK